MVHVTCNGNVISSSALPTIEAIHSIGCGGGLDYIEGARTWDTCQFGKTSNLPFTLHFKDRFNTKWAITIQNKHDVIKMVVPCGNEMIWYGDEMERTGSDDQTQLASLTFSYADGQQAGIRIQFEAWKYKNTGEALIDTQRWATILDNAIKGVGIEANIKSVF